MERAHLQSSSGFYSGDRITVENANLTCPYDVTHSKVTRFGFVLAALLLMALALRAAFIWKDRLWLDEVWSATFAVQPFIDVVIATLRFDPHPPLYYLQLWVWASISHSTLWLF